MNVILFIFISIFFLAISSLIGYGISYKKRFRADPDIRIKNPVFGLDAQKCSKLPVRCNDEDIGMYTELESIEGVSNNDRFCANTCSETLAGKTFKCLPASDFVKVEDNAEVHVNDHYCVQTEIEDDFRNCNKKYGGVMAWSGEGATESQSWKCFCNWSQYAGGDNCTKLNPQVCGGNGSFKWDATTGQTPESVMCECDPGYVLMKSLVGKPDICVKESNATMYNDLYELR